MASIQPIDKDYCVTGNPVTAFPQGRGRISSVSALPFGVAVEFANEDFDFYTTDGKLNGEDEYPSLFKGHLNLQINIAD